MNPLAMPHIHSRLGPDAGAGIETAAGTETVTGVGSDHRTGAGIEAETGSLYQKSAKDASSSTVVETATYETRRERSTAGAGRDRLRVVVAVLDTG